MIKYDIFLPVQGKAATNKSDIMAKSKPVATRKARLLYGNTVIVVEPYDPNWNKK